MLLAFSSCAWPRPAADILNFWWKIEQQATREKLKERQRERGRGRDRPSETERGKESEGEKKRALYILLYGSSVQFIIRAD